MKKITEQINEEIRIMIDLDLIKVKKTKIPEIKVKAETLILLIRPRIKRRIIIYTKARRSLMRVTQKKKDRVYRVIYGSKKCYR